MKQGSDLSPLVSKKIRKDWNWMEHISSWSILMTMYCVET